MANFLKNVCHLVSNNSFSIASQIGILPQCFQIRFKSLQPPFYGLKNNWPKFSMIKDQRRRMMLKEYGPYRLRYNALYKAKDLLPVELRDIALHELHIMVPLDTYHCRIMPRCALSSKNKKSVMRWKLSRHIFRDLADYNKLAGVQRALW